MNDLLVYCLFFMFWIPVFLLCCSSVFKLVLFFYLDGFWVDWGGNRTNPAVTVAEILGSDLIINPIVLLWYVPNILS